jgi:hypothetical protein
MCLRSIWPKWAILLLLATLDLLVVALIPTSRVDRPTEGVWVLELIGDCYLDYHASAQALDLVCPRVDYMMLWPLPFDQMWSDPMDRSEPWWRWYTKRSDSAMFDILYPAGLWPMRRDS